MKDIEGQRFIKCPECGREYCTSSGEFENKNITKTCSCGYSFTIGFYGYCPNCSKHVGMNPLPLGERAKHFGKEALKVSFVPFYYIKAGFRHLDTSKPYDHGIGTCMFCGAKFARCPNCHTAIELMEDNKSKELVYCTECGQKFRIS